MAADPPGFIFSILLRIIQNSVRICQRGSLYRLKTIVIASKNGILEVEPLGKLGSEFRGWKKIFKGISLKQSLGGRFLGVSIFG